MGVAWTSVLVKLWEGCGIFFFQAEDGIRDYKVTGVQTCALPISLIGLGLGWSALNQAKNLEQTTVASKQASEALGQRLAKEDEINQQLQSDLKVIADKLNVTQGEQIGRAHV